MNRISMAIDVSDGSLEDWDDAPVKLYDDQGNTSISQTDLAYVSFDYNETWLYVRWDVYDNLSYSPQVLYDMGINLTGNLIGNDNDWDIYVSAETERIGGIPVLVNISIRDRSDNHIWNASDDGNMTEDGSIYFDPTPGLPPGNLSVEARFPLVYLGIPTGVIFGQFRSHPSTSVNSVVKDRVPDSGYIILTIDNLPPELSNLNDSPDPQENGDYVNISVDVTDDIGVETVWVNITHPDGSWTNVSMMNGTGDKWYLNAPYNDLGIYSYTVWANDTNNWNSTGPREFTIKDRDGPYFNNLNDAPDPQENGGFVNITGDVTDDIAVDTVWINITYPDGSSTNISMFPGAGDKWYFVTSYDDLGIYTYTIWANDTSDNWNSTSLATFTIQDTDGPYLDNLNDVPDPQENGDYVNITVDVTDDIGVEEVWVVITYPDSSWANVSMVKGSGDQWYFYTSYDDLGIHSYRMWAKDTNNNWNDAGPGTFTIQDTDGPNLDNLNAEPDPQENGDPVNISVDIIDDIGVDTVWINITYPDGSWANVSMKPGEGDKWYFDTIFDEPGIYSYKIWTNDTSNNWESSGTEIFTVQDTDGPVLDNLDDDPDPQKKGRNVNITVDVIDDVGVDEVWIHITYPDGKSINESMSKGPGDQWFYDKPFSKSGDYTYTVWAVDTSGNWNSTEPDEFEIEPPMLLVMILMLFFWPLLLILFTMALAGRYGFGNRFKGDIVPIKSALADHYAKHPENTPDEDAKIQNIILLSHGTGIPLEEYFLSSFTPDKDSQMDAAFLERMSRDLRVMKESFGGKKGIT